MRVQIGELGEHLQQIHRRVVQPLGGLIAEELGVGAAMEAVRRSPVGTPKTSKHPGKYRASHGLTPGPVPVAKTLRDAPSYPIPGEPEFRAAVRGLRPGQSLHLTNDAKSDGNPQSYASQLEPPRPKSKQAPQGVYARLEQWLTVNAPRLMEKAIRRVTQGVRF